MTPLELNAFLKIWRTHYLELRISDGRTDYCDVCMGMKNHIKGFTVEQKERAVEVLKSHRDEAETEFKH